MARKSNRPTQTAVGSGVEESQWRKVHPITPLAKTWAVSVALIAFFTYQNAEIIRDIAEAGVFETFGLEKVLFAIAAALLLIVLIAGLYSWLAWRRMSFAVTDEAVYYREGILARNQRHARLSRVQAVNISHPLVGRIFKLGNIEVEVAGGAGSSLKFGLLKTDELESLRREIMYKAAGAKKSAAAGGPGIAGDTRVAGTGEPSQNEGVMPAAPSNDQSGEQPPADFGFEDRSQLIYKVPTGRLLASTLLNLGVLTTVFIGVLIMGVSVGSMIIFHASLTTLIPVIIAAFVSITTGWRAFASNYNFTASVSSNGIRVTSGLTATRAQTIPPRRIHGVTVTQPFFWRYFGWYQVKVIQAGFAGSEEDAAKADHSILLPVGTRDQMLRALWMVYPDLGVHNPIQVIGAGIEGMGVGPGFIPNPERSKLFDWISWHRRAIMLTDVAVLIRSGRITRQLTVLTYGRFQSVEIDQGPWDRKRKLVNIQFQLVQDSVQGYHTHMDEAVGAEVLQEATRRALLKREQESPEAWAKRAMEHAFATSDQLFSRVPEAAPQTPVQPKPDVIPGPTEAPGFGPGPVGADAPAQGGSAEDVPVAQSEDKPAALDQNVAQRQDAQSYRPRHAAPQPPQDSEQSGSEDQ